MAVEQLGLGAKLVFDTKTAVAEMSSANRAFGSLSVAVDQASAGVSKVAGGLKTMTFSAAGTTVALGLGAQQAFAFEDQMARINSVMMPTPGQMAQLTDQARKLGISTVFSAREVGAAQEELARAGFTTNEILTATPGVLSAAAAEGMPLAQAADIVASTLRGLTLDTSQAVHIADTLALASARTATNIVELGEGMKYVAPKANELGIPLEEVTAALGLLSNAGIKSTMAGTSLRNMLAQLTTPSNEVLALFGGKGGLNSILMDASGKMRPLGDITAGVAAKINSMPSVLERARMAEELFGLRGESAFVALSKVGKESMDALVAELRGSSEGIGAAGRMAKMRLDSVTGALTLMRASVTGFFIEVFSPFQRGLQSGIRAVTNVFNGLLTAMGQLRTKGELNFREITKETGVTNTSVLVFIADVAKAFQMLFNFLRNTAVRLVPIAQRIIGFIHQIDPTVRRLGLVFAMAGVAIVPVLGAISGALFILGPIVSGLISIFSGLGAIVMSVFSPHVLLLIAGVILAFKMFQKDGDTMVQTISRIGEAIWTYLKPAFDWLVDTGTSIYNALAQVFTGFREGFLPFIGEVKASLLPAFENIKTTFQEIVGLFSSGGQSMSIDFLAVGKNLGMFVAALLDAVAKVVSFITFIISRAIPAFKPFVDQAVGVAEAILRWVSGGSSFKTMLEDVIVKLSSGLVEAFLTPVRAIISIVMTLMEKLAKYKAVQKWLGITPELVAQSRDWMNEMLTFNNTEFGRLTKQSQTAVDTLKEGRPEGLQVAATQLSGAVSAAGVGLKADAKTAAETLKGGKKEAAAEGTSWLKGLMGIFGKGKGEIEATGKKTKAEAMAGVNDFLKSLGVGVGPAVAAATAPPKPTPAAPAPAAPVAPLFGRIITPTVEVAAPATAPAAAPAQEKIQIENRLFIDGAELAVALGQRRIDFVERRGAKLSPEQRRALLEMGA